MQQRSSAHLSTGEQLLLWGTLALLAVYTFGFFFRTPYAGFNFENNTGLVTRVYLPQVDEPALQAGDILLALDGIPFERFKNELTRPFFEGVAAGQIVMLEVERPATGTLTIPYRYPGFTQTEFMERLPSQWWLAFLFWGWAAAALLWVRPRATAWRLLVGFNLSMAVFWVAGSGPSHWHLWFSAYLVKVLIFIIPILYLHLNWVYPTPLGRWPRPLVWLAYLAAAGLALLNALNLVPGGLDALSLLAGLLGGGLLLGVQSFRQQGRARQTAQLLAFAHLLALLPVILAGVGYAFDLLPGNAFAGSLLALPLLPGIYLFAMLRARLGGMELRASQTIVQVSYLVLLLAAALLVGLFLALAGLEAPTLISIGMVFVAALLTLYFFPRYERWLQVRLLGMPLPPEGLERQFAARITASLDMPTLLEALCHQTLPTLLVRQSALLRRNAPEEWELIYAEGLDESALNLREAESLPLPQGQFIAPEVKESAWGWVRLVLPLRVGGELTGLWLLGRRDPDDYYSPLEQDFFQHLADQTGLALGNIQQAHQLRALYQANVDTHERERARLARDLHDDILNRLATLLPDVTDPAQLAALQELIASLRQTVTGLRPAMLTYGLQTALDELTDILEDRPGLQTRIEFSIPPTEARFDPNIELHFFRIVQQACENALRHAQPSRLHIHGEVAAHGVALHIEDDGLGFVPEERLNLVDLLNQHHFGLAGMLERAALIGANLEIQSAPGSGTRVSIHWDTESQAAF